MIDAAILAASRFGFAARGGDLSHIAGDPRGWALQQLKLPPPLLAASLPRADRMVAEELEARQLRRTAAGDAKAAEQKSPDQKADQKNARDAMRGIFIAEVGARMDAAIASNAPLLERLVLFWSNHFTVSAMRPVVRGFVGAFEREAIRPYVTGRFVDMLMAVAKHPGMGFYLDNVASIGPNSPVGKRRERGLNENLGRELLELHTLGVDGGYTQADVEALARLLTGWTVGRLKDPSPGSFRFEPRIHEPGPKQLLGKTYPEAGIGEGEAALRDLARHPSTARHIATKLARHFIADEPPQAAIERIAKRFRDSDGDLRQVTAAVIESEEAWRMPFAKVKSPTELVIAACRVAGHDNLPAESLVASLRTLDQPAFLAPSPAGWPDTAAAWVSPEAVLRRAEWCQSFAERLDDSPDPVELAAASFGEALPAETQQAIRRAPSRRVGLALLLASPQFQRR